MIISQFPCQKTGAGGNDPFSMISEPDRREIFLTLLSGCESRLRAFLAGALAAADERADVFQDVVLILWRNFGKYDSARPFTPWALGVAVRRMKEEYRRRNRRPGLLAEDHLERLADALASLEPPSPADPSRHSSHQPAEEEALVECLAALPEHSARLVRRRYFDEADMDGLSAEFRQSPASLYQALSRLRRRLADCIRQRLSQEAGKGTLSSLRNSGDRSRCHIPQEQPEASAPGAPHSLSTPPSLPFPS